MLYFLLLCTYHEEATKYTLTVFSQKAIFLKKNLIKIRSLKLGWPRTYSTAPFSGLYTLN